MAEPHSSSLVQDPSLFPLWDARAPFSPSDEMPDLDVVTHVIVERAQPGGYHYLHETSLAFHRGELHAVWANHRTHEANEVDECLRGRRSTDGGLTWGPADVLLAAPAFGYCSFNHPVLFAHQGRLYGYFTSWRDRKPNTAVFLRDDATGQWQPTGGEIPGFLPFAPPRLTAAGHYIIPGEIGWETCGVALSHGQDITRWDLVTVPCADGVQLRFAETSLMEQGDQLVAICRPVYNGLTAPAATSADSGRTWTPLRRSNFPLKDARPHCLRLSTGQQALICNHLEEGRPLLMIAVTPPGGARFTRVWKIRHQQSPKRRLFPGWDEQMRDTRKMVGTGTEWSYPFALEHEGRLYLSYTHGKEDACLSIIPLRVLAT